MKYAMYNIKEKEKNLFLRWAMSLNLTKEDSFSNGGLLFRGDFGLNDINEFNLYTWNRLEGKEEEIWCKSPKRLMILTKDLNDTEGWDIREESGGRTQLYEKIIPVDEDIQYSGLGFYNNYVLPYIEARISEIRSCLSAKAALSVIFLSGSTLEGVLLGLAQNNPAIYNQAKSAPKDNKTGRTRQFHEWTLSNLIDVSYEVVFLREDVKKFSHALRDFRNYIHPFQQMSEHFYPDDNTARICFQVLKAALFQITQNKKI